MDVRDVTAVMLAALLLPPPDYFQGFQGPVGTVSLW